MHFPTSTSFLVHFRPVLVTACLLAVSYSKLLPDAILIDVLLQPAEVVAQRAFTLLADVIHIHAWVGGHDGQELRCLAVLQRQAADQAEVKAVAELHSKLAGWV